MQNWFKSSLISRMKDLAARRKLEDLTIGPVLTVSVVSFFSLFYYHSNKLAQLIVIAPDLADMWFYQHLTGKLNHAVNNLEGKKM